MTIYSDLRNAIRLGTEAAFSASGITGVPVIFSHQNGPEPTTSYCAINVLTWIQRGQSDQAPYTSDAKYTVVADGSEFYDGPPPSYDGGVYRTQDFKVVYEVVCQFNFTGNSGADYCQMFAQSVCNNPVIREAFQRNNVAPIRKSMVRRVPQKRDSDWVEYFTVDVTFTCSVITKQPIEWISNVSVSVNSGDVVSIPPIPN